MSLLSLLLATVLSASRARDFLIGVKHGIDSTPLTLMFFRARAVKPLGGRRPILSVPYQRNLEHDLSLYGAYTGEHLNSQEFLP